MSDTIKHECAVAMLRLLGERDGGADCDAGGTILSLLLEKQHNRGQDGAGAAALTPDPEPGSPAWSVFKSAGENPLGDVLARLARRRRTGERLFLGHLRYATYGKGDETFCHPFVHDSPRLSQALLVAGNFNFTNAGDLFESFRAAGNHPSGASDGYLLCELLAEALAAAAAGPGRTGDPPVLAALRQTLPRLDGAFTLCGMTGDGWAFAVRDAHGIRPGWYFADSGAVAVASERPAIQAALDCPTAAVKELEPGVALLVSPGGEVRFERVLDAAEPRPCVFERIYFSRANDADIHRERKALGAALAGPVLRAAGDDLGRTFFSYIPNSAQVAFHGLLEALWTEGLAEGRPVRFGQVAVKDAKFRTFISDAAARREIGKHVYDVTYGLVRPGEDTLVVLDDSIVRGTTMRDAILPMLDRLGPRRIVVASSAPPIRYPDCYGIDMSSLDELVAFRALGTLLGENADRELSAALESGAENPLAPLYAAFSAEEHAAAVARLLTPPGMRAQVAVVYQEMDALRRACPGRTGDWYFTGNYPTPGGRRVLRRALENHLARRSGRAY